MDKVQFKTQLSSFDNSWYNPGGNVLSRFFWFCFNAVFFKSSIMPVFAVKRSILRLFGAKIGKGVVFKPHVNIKYPWNLEIGDYSWVGENVWIDNLDKVKIGANVCISQGALLLCGNHNFKSESFDLAIQPITLEDGVWIGAKSVVCPGVTCQSHSVLAVGSVATTEMESFGVYQGNPAQKVKNRI